MTWLSSNVAETRANGRTGWGRAGSIAATLLIVGSLLVVELAGVLGLGQSSAAPQQARSAVSAGAAAASIGAETRPNIVFILTDDLSMNLVPYLSAVRAMKQDGTTFANAFVADSLCCPSRASILTGRYPHNTHVRVNENNRHDYTGGYRAFEKFGNQNHTYAVALHKAGYRTGFLGKYLNGYDIAHDPIPPGWDEWHASDNGYTELAGSYRITGVHERGTTKDIRRPNAYLNDLLGARARGFVARTTHHRQPFFLQISTFAPHQRIDGRWPLYPPAMRDRPGRDYPHGDCGTKPSGGRYDCRDLAVHRTGAFNDVTYQKLDKKFRDRVRMMQSLNDQIVRLRKQLAANGQLANTHFVFSSDNGYHLGEHGLLRGKGSAYDHDTRIPLIVDGPGLRRGQVRTEIVQNVDLSPTFQQLAGLRPMPADGHGLLTLLRGDHTTHWPTHWRKAALIEHKPELENGNVAVDPDLEAGVGGMAGAGFVPTYHPYDAIRTNAWLYVTYLDGSRPELYDLTTDPGQDHNLAREQPRVVRRLNAWLDRYAACGARTIPCWRTGR